MTSKSQRDKEKGWNALIFWVTGLSFLGMAAFLALIPSTVMDFQEERATGGSRYFSND